jgi:hypothetical protein
MSEPTTAETICRRCKAVLDPADNYCRRCGTATVESAGLPMGERPSGWSESPWVVLPLLFVVLGPLALPLLWRSRQFTLVWKCVLTVLVAGLTVYLLCGVWQLSQAIVAPLREFERLQRM